jgi:hypothetical protein
MRVVLQGSGLQGSGLQVQYSFSIAKGPQAVMRLTHLHLHLHLRLVSPPH